MLDELPRDFQTSVISVWLTNSPYGQWKLKLVWLRCATRKPIGPTSLFPRYSRHCFFHEIQFLRLVFRWCHDCRGSNICMWWHKEMLMYACYIGLFLNPSKSELVNLGLDETVFLRETHCMNSILENVSFVKKEDVTLLGLPLTSTAIRPQFRHKLSIFKAMTDKLSLFDRHPAYFLFLNWFSMQKQMYLLRSSPTFQHPDLLADFDDCLKSCATDICNVSFDDIGWIQATLPIRLGGIDLRRVSDLALSA